MINTSKLLGFLGSKSSNNDLIKFLTSDDIGYNKHPELEEDDYDAYLEYPNKGTCVPTLV